MYVLMKNGKIVTWAESLPPAGFLGLPDYYYVPENWVVAIEEPRPVDTETIAYIADSPILVDGVPTVKWSAHTRDASEIALYQSEKNRRTIEESLDLRMAALQAIIDDTNANINNNPAARIKDLARVMRLLIRVSRNNFIDSK